MRSRCYGMIRLASSTTIDWLGEQYPGRFRIPAAHAATTITGRALHGPERELSPGAAGTGGPVRLHPLRGTQGDHRRTALRPPAVPADPQPLGMALRWVAAGETFLALQQGLQNALWTLGGVPEVVRSDNTWRPPTNCAAADRALITPPCWTTTASAPPANPAENGVAEHAHYRLKDAIQALAPAVLRTWPRQMAWYRESWSWPGLPAASPGAGIRPRQGAQVGTIQERDIATASPVPPHREGGQIPSVPTGWKCTTRTTWSHGAGAWSGGSQRQLPPRHRLPGAQAVPRLASGAAPRFRLTYDASGMATGRRGVRAHPTCRRHHGSDGGQALTLLWKRDSPGGGAGPGRAQGALGAHPPASRTWIYDRLLTGGPAGVCG